MLSLHQEFRRMRRWPAIEYQTLVCNALIVTICFYLLPTTLKEWLFSEFQGHQTFVMVLVSWMISDVISTNLLGHDPDSALKALDTAGGIARLVRVKALALSICVGVTGLLVSLAVGALHGQVLRGLLLSPMYFAMPLVTVCVGALVGICFPYRLRSARWRWDHRRRWKMNLRWLLLVLVPTWFLGSIATALSFPLHFLIHGGHPDGGVGGGMGAIWHALSFSGVVSIEAVLAFIFLPFIGQILADRRSLKLHEYLISDAAG